MQEYSTTSNDIYESPRTGEAPDVNETVGSSEATESAVAHPIAGADEHSASAEALGSKATSRVPAPAAATTNSMTSASQSSVAKKVHKVLCIEEPVRTGKDKLTSWQPPFEVDDGSEASLKEIIRRAGYVRAPLQATPVPTGSGALWVHIRTLQSPPECDNRAGAPS